MDEDVKFFFGACAVVIGVVVALWSLVLIIGVLTARYTPQAGQVGVVRQGSSALWPGDWFNGHNIKQVIPPGAGNTSIGLGSEVHAYPAASQQRFYSITSDPSRGDRLGVDYVQVPTSDGVNVSIEATIYFYTAFDGSPAGNALARDFDNQFGTRTFPVAGSTDQLHAWDGSDGWEAFLDTIIRPIIDNDLRQQIATDTCAQLVSSCSLVYNQTGGSVVKPVTTGQQNNSSIANIQNAINASLQADVKSTLGEDFFSRVEFRLSKVELPVVIQNEIDNAQAEYAKVATSEAQLKQARVQAQANAAREAGYRACPACAAIDQLKAIPSNVTTFAPGAGFAITSK